MACRWLAAVCRRRSYFPRPRYSLVSQHAVSKCFNSHLPPTEMSSNSTSHTTHFGFDQVPEAQKAEKVYEVFEKVAEKYDLMNDLMSGGLHRVWKDELVRTLGLNGLSYEEMAVHVQKDRPLRILDLAGGTGDISFKIADSLGVDGQSFKGNASPPHIVVSDINRAMLEVGVKRSEEQRGATMTGAIDGSNAGLMIGLSEREAAYHVMQDVRGISFEWVQADAENLPFENDTFDVATMSFGIRNCTHISRVLEEVYRVLRPDGGRFVCLEFSHVENAALRSMYDLYSFNVIPPLGQIVSNDWKSYQYLVESIRNFPKQDVFAQMFRDARFSRVSYSNMTFGIVCLHSGVKESYK